MPTVAAAAAARDADGDVDMAAEAGGAQDRPRTSSAGKGKENPASVRHEEQTDTLPWVEKYRPKTLDDLVSHKDITTTIQRFMDENRLPHLLFYGPPGTGKTSTILACAKRLYGPQWKTMVLETAMALSAAAVQLNASDDRGIDVVREQIRNFASTRKMFSSGFKMIILDEADSMTQAAQTALRRVIEKFTRNVRFCLICNYVSKIIPALQSRCTRFRFAPLERDQVMSRLDHVIESERITVTEDGKQALLKLSCGDMRRALNVLQASSAAYPRIDETAVYTCTGNPLPQDVESIVNWMLNDEFSTALSNINALKTEKGLALSDVISNVHGYLEHVQLPQRMRMYLLDKLADVEYKLAMGGTEKIQLTALLGAFKIGIELAAQESGR